MLTGIILADFSQKYATPPKKLSSEISLWCQFHQAEQRSPPHSPLGTDLRRRLQKLTHDDVTPQTPLEKITITQLLKKLN